MQFEYDIYISFSNADNQTLSDGQRGWVANFQRFLDYLLAQQLGQKPKFLYYANGEKPSASQISKAAIMATIVSPNFVRSQDCIEDINSFYEEANKANLTEIEGRSRVFKIVKFPVDNDEKPSKIASLLSYDLFHYDTITGDVSDYKEYFSSDAIRNYWMKLVNLSLDMFEVLKDLKIDRETRAMVPPTEKGEYVYLADTGQDLDIQRNIIKRELVSHGFRVLPDRDLPTNLKELEAAVRKDLENCCLSIHMIGDDYGEIPKGSDVSIVEIQNQLTSEYFNIINATKSAFGETTFNRLIWLSPDAKLENERQKLYVERLLRDAESMAGAEVVETPLEDFKGAIWNKLINDYGSNGFTVQAQSGQRGDQPSIYLIYDRIDMESAENVINSLKSKNLDIKLPLFEGELMAVRNNHISSLTTCDAAIIYADLVNDKWVQVKLLDLLKAPGLGRSYPLENKALYLGKSAIFNKEMINSFNVTVIQQPEYGTSETLTNFLENIK